MKHRAYRRLLPAFLLVGILLAALSAGDVQGQVDELSDEPTAVAEDKNFVTKYYLDGGPIMHVLLVCSIATVALAVYCFAMVSPRRMMPRGLYESLVRNVQSRDVGGAYALCQENLNSFTKVVSAGLLKVNFERDQGNKVSMEEAAGMALDEEETKAMLWVNYLNVIATLAPMIGLFGTVTGMIAAFGDLAAGKSEAKDLAGGINTAMLTTAGGLMVGIPAMFFYFFFRNRLSAIIMEIQRNASFLIAVLSGEVRLEGGAPVEEVAAEAGELDGGQGQ